MSVQDSTEQLWGGETDKAVANFPVSGERVPVAVVRWLGRIKGASARVNADLGLLDAALAEATHRLLPALERLERSLAAKAEAFADIVKAGRTHLMDAVPVTLGQEFSGYAAQIRLGAERVRATLGRVGQIPLGGTATGTGLNTHPEFAERVRQRLSEEKGLRILPPADPFEGQAARDALVELSGALKVIAVSMNKVANDIALMGSGPRAGLG